jgi:hypothetical protein
MDKVFSTRIDASVLDLLERTARRLGLTKKRFTEDAIRLFAERHAAAPGAEGAEDIWSETLGAWRRREKPETTIRNARDAFSRTFRRHHADDRARLRR